MAIIVTGGGGYIGRWLANELAGRGERVIAVDRMAPDPAWEPRLPTDTIFVEGDVTDRAVLTEAVGRAPVSAIIHLAGIVTMGCEQNPDLCMKVNLDGTRNAWKSRARPASRASSSPARSRSTGRTYRSRSPRTRQRAR